MKKKRSEPEVIKLPRTPYIPKSHPTDGMTIKEMGKWTLKNEGHPLFDKTW